MLDNGISVKDIRKTFKVGSQDVEVLKGVTFDIAPGDFCVVFGPSGCGKSTLLHILLGLEPPSSGNIVFAGFDMYVNDSSQDTRAIFRRNNVGMVYQQANWVKALNVRENVAFPLTLLGMGKSETYNKALQALKTVNMDSWAEYVPTELSSGQQQRVSLARSIINDPKVIVADEPTGNLDFKAGEEMMSLLANLAKENKKTVVMVTHDLEYLKYATRIVKMLDGQVEHVYTGDELAGVVHSVASKRGALDSNEGAAAPTPTVVAEVQSNVSVAPEVSVPVAEPAVDVAPDVNVQEKNEVVAVEEPSTVSEAPEVPVIASEPEVVTVPEVVVKPKATGPKAPKKFNMKKGMAKK